VETTTAVLLGNLMLCSCSLAMTAPYVPDTHSADEPRRTCTTNYGAPVLDIVGSVLTAGAATGLAIDTANTKIGCSNALFASPCSEDLQIAGAGIAAFAAVSLAVVAVALPVSAVIGFSNVSDCRNHSDEYAEEDRSGPDATRLSSIRTAEPKSPPVFIERTARVSTASTGASSAAVIPRAP
jgi:hypothetical protein